MGQPSEIVTSYSCRKQRTCKPFHHKCLETKNHLIIRRNLYRSCGVLVLQLQTRPVRSAFFGLDFVQLSITYPKEKAFNNNLADNQFQCFIILLFNSQFSTLYLVPVASHTTTVGLHKESSLQTSSLEVKDNNIISSFSTFSDEQIVLSQTLLICHVFQQLYHLSGLLPDLLNPQYLSSYCEAQTLALYSGYGLSGMTRGEESIPSACWLHSC